MTSPSPERGRSGDHGSESAGAQELSRSRSPRPPQRRSISPRSASRGRSPRHSPRRNGNGHAGDGRSRSHSRGRSRSLSRNRARSDGRSESRSPLPKSSKIVVERLTRNVHEAHLHEIFGIYGDIKDLDLPLNRAFNTNRGIAYIIFTDPSAAESAISHMHEAQLDGAIISVSIVLPRRKFSHSPPPARMRPGGAYNDRERGRGPQPPSSTSYNRPYPPPPAAGERERGGYYGGGGGYGPPTRYRSPPGGRRRRSPPPPHPPASYHPPAGGRYGRRDYATDRDRERDFSNTYRPQRSHRASYSRSRSRSRSRSPRRSRSRSWTRSRSRSRSFSSRSRSLSRTPPRRGYAGRRRTPPTRGPAEGGGRGRRSPSYSSYGGRSYDSRSRSRSRSRGGGGGRYGRR